eukprot:2084430-Prymnesium_polylepis.1
MRAGTGNLGILFLRMTTDLGNKKAQHVNAPAILIGRTHQPRGQAGLPACSGHSTSRTSESSAFARVAPAR